MIQGNRIRPVSSLAGRCLLILAAWQGPIPWCHCHGTLANTSDSESTWLSDHLRSYHSAALAFLNVDFGWHMHVAFPEAPGEDDGSTAPKRRELLPQVDATTSLMESARLLIELPAIDSAVVAQLAAPCSGADAPDVSAHFFDSFAPSLPLPLRFCIARC